jgi:hypothetical protein
MQREQLSFVKAEKDPGDGPVRKVRSNLEEAIGERPNQRHAYGPAILDPLQIESDFAPIVRVQFDQPVPDRLIPSRSLVENQIDLLRMGSHSASAADTCTL